MESELLELLADTITYEPPDGTYTDRGQANFGTSQSIACRIEPASGEQIIRGNNGEERVAKWTIYIDSATISPEGRLTLPSGFDPQQPPFFAVGRVPDELGGHHTVLHV